MPADLDLRIAAVPAAASHVVVTCRRANMPKRVRHTAAKGSRHRRPSGCRPCPSLCVMLAPLAALVELVLLVRDARSGGNGAMPRPAEEDAGSCGRQSVALPFAPASRNLSAQLGDSRPRCAIRDGDLRGASCVAGWAMRRGVGTAYLIPRGTRGNSSSQLGHDNVLMHFTRVDMAAHAQGFRRSRHPHKLFGAAQSPHDHRNCHLLLHSRNIAD